MRTPLPDDYKQFIATYGSGRLAEFIRVLSPFAGGALNLLATSHAILTGHREVRANFPEQFPFALFPEPNGLLPVAVTDNGDIVHWLTNYDRDWDIVVNESRGPNFERFPVNLTSFLAAVLGGSVDTWAFGSLSTQPKRFDPIATLR